MKMLTEPEGVLDLNGISRSENLEMLMMMSSVSTASFMFAPDASGYLCGSFATGSEEICRGFRSKLGFARDQRRVRGRMVTRAGMEESFERMANKLAEEMGMAKKREDNFQKNAKAGAAADQGESTVEVGEGRGGMKRVRLAHGPSQQTAEVYEYGAAVTSWTWRGTENFWLSQNNIWKVGGKAIRGGIPICWPQFGPYGPMVQHGFARVSEWELGENGVMDDGSVQVNFILNDDMGGLAAEWGPKFETKLTVILSNAGLETKLTVLNKDNKPLEFTAAFHNYFKIFEVSDVRLFGFENLKYKDRLQNDKVVESKGAIEPSGLEIKSGVDRIYLNAPDELAMFAFSQLRVVKIKKTQTLPDTTLWNPHGAEGCDPGWNNFMCIEPAAIQKPVVLPVGETWVGSQLLGVE